MVAARAADSVAILGAPGPVEAALAGEIGLDTGLNGRTLVIDVGTEARARVEAAAAKAGALVEFEWAPVTMLPIDAGTFDVAVINRQLASLDGQNRVACCQEALRIIKNPNGRVVVIEGVRRPGLFGLFPTKLPGLPPEEVKDALTRAGAKAVRLLADVDGVVFFEAK
jgi:ubiquinone/menaquinone biosynthesis C-methylase UbiE